MKQIELIRLERMARNLPVRRINMNSVMTKLGPVYIAYGERSGIYMGFTACRGIAHGPIEFKKDTEEDNVIVALVAISLQFTRDCFDVGLFEDPEHFSA